MSYEYEVAFSFLQRDEPLAVQLNDQLQNRVKSFIYTEQQKNVAGKDGEEVFNRVFGKEARLVVVLYRTGWGETSWTRIESTAIRNRAHDEGYDFSLFIPLEQPPQVPKWLPKARLWLDFSRWGIGGAAAVIEQRIKDAGGEVHQETLEEHAQRTKRARDFDEKRKRYKGDEGARDARKQAEGLRPLLEGCAARVKASSGTSIHVMPMNSVSTQVLGLGRALLINWRQTYGNSLDGARLEVTLLNGQLAGPGQFQWEEPNMLKSMRFEFDLLPTEVGGWVAQDAQHRQFSTDALAEHLMKFYLENGREK